MNTLLYFLLLMLSLSRKCTAQNHHQLCENIASVITCTCTSSVRQLDLEDDHDGFFQDAFNITITNCGLVHLTPPSLVNAEHLQSLYLINNGEVILDTEFPRLFSTLVIVNVTSLVELHKPLFNKRQHMKLLKIQNTNIKKISKHTFSELRVEHIEFSNSRFYNLTEYSIYISDKQIQSAVKMPFYVNIKNCEFTDIPSNSITLIGAQEVKIEKVKFAGALNMSAMVIFANIANITENTFHNLDKAALMISNTTYIYFMKNNIEATQNNSLHFNLSYVKSFKFQENILPCHCKSVCNVQTTATLQNIEFFYRAYRRLDFNLCSEAQNNFCSQNNSLSQIIYLQKQCDSTHYLYNTLQDLNCTHSKNDTKECRNNTYIKSASLSFTFLAVVFSISAFKRHLS